MDRADLLEKAALYLRKHSTQPAEGVN